MRYFISVFRQMVPVEYFSYFH